MSQLPEFLQNQLPCFITDQRATDKRLMQAIYFDTINGVSFKQQSSTYNEKQTDQFQRKHLSYLQSSVYKESKQIHINQGRITE